ncbi:MAG: hypothetical protein QXZ09_03480 [Candidatus Methanomethylicaceae archaeon]
MPTTLAEIRNRIQSRLSEPIISTGWFTPDTVNIYINDAIRFVFQKIVAANPDYFGLRTAQITTQDGVKEYAVPIDAFEIRYLEIDNGGTKQKLYEATFEQRWPEINKGFPRVYYWMTDYTNPSSDPATKIGLIPTPDGQYNINIWYIPRPKKLVNDSDTIDMPDEVVDIVVPLATAYALKSDKQAAQQEEAEFQVRMTQYLTFVTRGKSGGPTYVSYPYPLW